MKKILYFILIISTIGCSYNQGIHYSISEDDIVEVKHLIKEVVIDTPLIGSWSRPYIINEYLVISDANSIENQVNLFKKDDFSYVTGTGLRGQGPKEITTVGALMSDETHRKLYVSDYGKMNILIFEMDSLLTNPDYFPERNIKMNETTFPDRFYYVNDTLCYARTIIVEEGKHFQQNLVKWNMKTSKYHNFIEGHPRVERKRSNFTVSAEHNLIVDCYTHHDLIGLYTLDGELKTYIYGSSWNDRTDNSMIYHNGVIICKDYILTGYSGGQNWSNEQFVNQFLVFDIHGNFIKSLKLGYRVSDFCYDMDNNRIFLVLNDEIQFAYLPLETIL